ncbi:MAG: CBS domain-containing protein [Deltaproteobacteria bacterium]|nr:CBS domain-containing protein [Deltaproteobacteria bacterium]MBI3386651.1 CBS domain-containing protein [Deltaproteobacteria bacterium]
MNEEAILEEEAIAAERVEEARALGTAILSKPIRALATLRSAINLPPTASVREAIERMNDDGVGCVLIERDGRLVGIFTERDVLKKVATSGIDIDRRTVESVMTAAPETLSIDARIAYALNKMVVGGFRHIPLVDAANRPVGIIAMRNVVEYMVDLFPHEVLNLPPEPNPNVARSREGA